MMVTKRMMLMMKTVVNCIAVLTAMMVMMMRWMCLMKNALASSCQFFELNRNNNIALWCVYVC